MFQSKYYKIITLFVNLCFKLFLLLELLFMYLSSFGMIYNTSVLPLGNDMLYYINIAIEKIGYHWHELQNIARLQFCRQNFEY